MDQKQKEISGFRFNIFDFLIILGILVCLTAVITLWIMIKNAKEETVYTDIYFDTPGQRMINSSVVRICHFYFTENR
jgi:hypothetical protein